MKELILKIIPAERNDLICLAYHYIDCIKKADSDIQDLKKILLNPPEPVESNYYNEYKKHCTKYPKFPNLKVKVTICDEKRNRKEILEYIKEYETRKEPIRAIFYLYNKAIIIYITNDERRSI